jgi:hypothetical protein
VVVLDEAAGLALMGRCGVEHMDGLAGQSWRRILETGSEEMDHD